MKRPAVSVVVSTCRRPHYLALTLRAILEQTLPPQQVLVVSDGEDAETRRIVDASGSDVVEYLEVPHAGRPAPARNAGLRAARAPLIAFCDDDDVWEPQKLEEQVAVLEARPDVVLVHTGASQIDEEGTVRGLRRAPPRRYDDDPLAGFLSLPFFHVLQSSILVRRTALERAGEYDEDPRLKGREDTELVIRIAARGGGRFARVPAACVRYRHAQSSVGRDPAYHLPERRDYFHAVLLARGTLTPAAHQRFVSNQFAVLALNSLRYRWSPTDARWYAAESRRHARSWLNWALHIATSPLAVWGPPALPETEQALR